MPWIYLSPHLDDVALSCGGLVAEQSQAGEEVSIWTLFAGDPPGGDLPPFARTQHAMWGLGRDAMAVRREEDRRACARLGASPVHLWLPDCVYRRSPEDGRPLYPSEEVIFGPIHPQERPLVDELSRRLAASLPSEAYLVCPLGVGGHVDHRLTRAAAVGLGRALWYYAEVPYVTRDPAWSGGHAPLAAEDGWKVTLFPVSQIALRIWQAAVAEFRSQVPVLWEGGAAMRSALRGYCRQAGGVRLWRR